MPLAKNHNTTIIISTLLDHVVVWLADNNDHVQTYCNKVVNLVQRIMPNSVVMCCIEMFALFGWGLRPTVFFICQ